VHRMRKPSELEIDGATISHARGRQRRQQALAPEFIEAVAGLGGDIDKLPRELPCASTPSQTW
jgi:hypothetical protein